jgi:recombination protein RecT
VPYKKTAQWIPMYLGMLNRFQRSGFFKSIKTDFHRSDDIAWRNWTDENGPHFLHENGPGKGEILHTYASATLTNGGFFLETMTPEDMEHVRSKSRTTRDDAPWKEWREQMERKTVLKRLLKILPTPVPLAHFAQDEDEDDSGGGDGTTEPWQPPPPPPRGAQAALQQFAQETEEQQTEQGTLIEHESPPAAPPSHQPTAGGDGGGPSATAPPSDVPQSVARSPVTPSPADASPAATDSVEIAYRRGQEAKKAGDRRTAYPGQYRTLEGEPLVKAWLKGYDQKPIDAP